MPVERRSFQPELEQELVSELVAEFRRGYDSPNAEPRIILEDTDGPHFLHVYVIWSRWRSIEGLTRSRIIMDAMEAALTQEDFSRITMAWGLTPQEWERANGGAVG